MYDPPSPKRTVPSPSGKPPTGVDSNISRPSPRPVDGGDNASLSPLWKMSGSELGNALILSQAQSNSLVVETYKRWVEAESNCRRYEREVAALKKQEGMSSKVKQEIASLLLVWVA
ncbi:hypothetical protein Hanom_Chr02g00104671 [Helianthus anomalus]